MDRIEKFRKIYYEERETVAARLTQLASRANLTKEERNQLDYEWKIYNDYYNTLDTAVEQGRMEEKLSVAIMMKNQGIPAETIAICTGLSLEEINAL